MPNDRELMREDSGTRLVYEIVDRHGPLTQMQVSRLADVTISCACKCLRLLEHQGYVQRAGQTSNQKGMMNGKLPWLYARTVKPLPDIRTQRAPAAPTPQELCDIMNAMIRRRG